MCGGIALATPCPGKVCGGIALAPLRGSTGSQEIALAPVLEAPAMGAISVICLANQPDVEIPSSMSGNSLELSGQEWSQQRPR